jgi:hypothetical protein
MVDDDKLDDLVDELGETNRNLKRLVDAIERGTRREQEEQGEADYPVDLWDVGRSSEKVTDELEYELSRQRAASSDGEVTPTYGGERDRVEFYIDIFTSGLEHLDAMNQKLSNDRFDEFVRELAIFYGAERELVEILEPGSVYFGIDIDKNNNIAFIASRSHFEFVDALGSFWYKDPAKDPATDAIMLPWSKLNIGTPTQVDNINEDFNLTPSAFIVRGTKDEVGIDSKLAGTINDRNSLELPQEYFGLL